MAQQQNLILLPLMKKGWLFQNLLPIKCLHWEYTVITRSFGIQLGFYMRCCQAGLSGVSAMKNILWPFSILRSAHPSGYNMANVQYLANFLVTWYRSENKSDCLKHISLSFEVVKTLVNLHFQFKSSTCLTTPFIVTTSPVKYEIAFKNLILLFMYFNFFPVSSHPECKF